MSGFFRRMRSLFGGNSMADQPLAQSRHCREFGKEDATLNRWPGIPMDAPDRAERVAKIEAEFDQWLDDHDDEATAYGRIVEEMERWDAILKAHKGHTFEYGFGIYEFVDYEQTHARPVIGILTKDTACNRAGFRQNFPEDVVAQMKPQTKE